MSYYLRQYPVQSGLYTEVWKIDRNTAFRLGITNPPTFTPDEGKTIWETLELKTGWFGPNGKNPFRKATLKPGEFYPRMARPNDQHPHEAPGANPAAQSDTNFIAVSRGQLTVLTRQLDRICQTVHPAESMLGTFGHDIRNLLILACTEVESHWRGVLVANGADKNRHFKTTDYVKLCKPMRLDEYAVEFPNYPWLPAITPFKDWDGPDGPTRQLAWYCAYNGVKHNSEHEFERASLGNSFAAVAACAIMVVAQFGLHVGLGQQTELQTFFHFPAFPTWPLSDVYIYPYGEDSANWSAVNFIL